LQAQRKNTTTNIYHLIRLNYSLTICHGMITVNKNKDPHHSYAPPKQQLPLGNAIDHSFLNEKRKLGWWTWRTTSVCYYKAYKYRKRIALGSCWRRRQQELFQNDCIEFLTLQKCDATKWPAQNFLCLAAQLINKFIHSAIQAQETNTQKSAPHSCASVTILGTRWRKDCKS
jgi:hypothetical protein